MAPRESSSQSVQRSDVPADLHEVLKHLSRLGASEREYRLAEMERDGMDALLATRARLYFRIPADPSVVSEGTVIDRYTIKSRIAEGGMGIVYRAAQHQPGRDVAFKTVHPVFASPNFYRRFKQEIATLAQLEYPGIVPIYEAGEFEDTHSGLKVPYYTMELVQGQTITNYCQSKELPLPVILKLMVDSLDALQFAHDRSIVHRDLKPGNLMVRDDGRPVIFDFGLAQFTHDLWSPNADDENPDEFHGASGTPSYMCPELFMARSSAPRAMKKADVYSFGIVLFELLTGKLPHRLDADASFDAIRSTILAETPDRVSQHLADCPPEVDEIVAKAISKAPHQRYGSASDFAKALIAYLDNAHPKIFLPDATNDSNAGAFWIPARGNFVPPTRWKLKKKLGSGSVGEVWLAVHEEIGEKRAIKFCGDSNRVHTLRREQALFHRLADMSDDPEAFVRVQEVSLDDAPHYIMMDYVDGRELPKWFAARGGTREVEEKCRLELVAQIADTLQIAHDAGVIHRDVKPSNVLVCGRADLPKAVLTDFGIGKVVSEHLLWGTQLGGSADMLTSEIGTFMYLAPEVMEGGVTTTRSDIYALGVLLFQIVVGDFNRSLPRDNLSEVADPLLRQDILSCTAQNPHERLESPATLAENLRNIEDRRNAEKAAIEQRELIERAAYRRGLIRAGALAAIVVAIMALLGSVAYHNAIRAEQAHGTSMINEAVALRATGSSGRAFESLGLLRQARVILGHDNKFSNDYLELLSLVDLKRSSMPLPDANRYGQLSFVNRSLTIGAYLDGAIVTLLPANVSSDLGLQRRTLKLSGPNNLRLVSESGRYLITRPVAQPEALELWNAEQGKLVCRLPFQVGPSAVDISEGEELCAVGGTGAIEIYSCTNGKRIMELKSKQFVNDRRQTVVAYDPTATFLATTGPDSLKVLVWNRAGRIAHWR